jgi:quinol monooxygenase YgiN
MDLAVLNSSKSVPFSAEFMNSNSYVVAADFHTRADGIEAMKQVVAEVTAPSLEEEGCQIYHWSQSAEEPTLFLLYMEWRDKACFETHIATPHVKHAEDRLKREQLLVEPSREWHFYRLQS